MRVRNVSIGRYVGLLLLVTAVVLWACYKLTFELSCMQHQQEMSQQIAELSRQLDAERLRARTALAVRDESRGSGASSVGLQGMLVQSLQAEVREYKRQIEALQARVSGSPPPAQQAPPERILAPQPAEPNASASPSVPDSNVRPADTPAPPVASAQITEDNLRAFAGRGAIGVAIITCKRTQYLKRAMDSFLRPARDPTHFPLVISQDAFDDAMGKMVQEQYVSTGLAFHVHHTHDPNANEIAKTFNQKRPHLALGYVRIAQHYGFVMKKMFDDFGFQQVIFLEEDMEISPDFYSYFDAMLPLVRNDSDLYCVSAWNDNGYANLVSDARAAFRTDFFPGLGWMMQRRMWDEVRDRWARGFWDEFMRRPDVRKGRQCIRPDVSRSFTFGEEGTSAGQFYKTHLSRIKLNDQAVDWAAADLRHLSSRESFDAYLADSLRKAAPLELSAVDSRAAPADGAQGGTLRVVYDDKEYKKVATKFDLMPDEKEGIRRMSYRGVIPFAWKGNRIFLYTNSWPQNFA